MKRSAKPDAITTNEALEALLGRKAAKRLRQLALQVLDEDGPRKTKDRQRKAAKKR